MGERERNRCFEDSFKKTIGGDFLERERNVLKRCVEELVRRERRLWFTYCFLVYLTVPYTDK